VSILSYEELMAEDVWENNLPDILAEINEASHQVPYVILHCDGDHLFECVVVDSSNIANDNTLKNILKLAECDFIMVIFYFHSKTEPIKVHTKAITNLVLQANKPKPIATHRKKQKDLETKKELDLYLYLLSRGINVERQVKTSSNHVIDLWIPGQLMIEVKRSTVSGNDICQCIEYASEYNIPILLVGEKISGSASRGLKGFNSLCPDRKIFYTTWDTVHDFIRGYLADNQSV
jgi:hypothetical protein